MKAINAEEIPNLKYEGWYWLSNETAPHILTDESFPVSKLETEESFVIEAQLWNNQEKINISIRYADGKLYITRYNLNEIPKDQLSPVRTLLGHRLEGSDLRILDLWQEVEIETGNIQELQTMKTLAPMCSVFVGFK